MSRVAIISDIHANFHALKAVQRDVRKQKPAINSYWMLGDAIGYGPLPGKTMKELLNMPVEPAAWLMGNHDAGLVGLKHPRIGFQMDNEPGWDQDAKDSIKQHFDYFGCIPEGDDYVDHLAKLKHWAQPRNNVFIAHGAFYPDNPRQGMLERYTNDPGFIEADFCHHQTTWDAICEQGLPVVVIYGHNHCPAFWERDPVGTAGNHRAWTQHPLPIDIPIPLSPGRVYHVNPGSVGFPRHADYPCPTYAVLDMGEETWTILFRQVSYRWQKTKQAMEEANLPERIIRERLKPCP